MLCVTEKEESDKRRIWRSGIDVSGRGAEEKGGKERDSY